MQHIKNRLPNIKREMCSKILHLKEKIKNYGGNEIEDIEKLRMKLLHCLTKFSNNFSDILEGTGKVLKDSSIKLHGGARIVNIFHVLFKGELEHIGPFKDLSDNNIKTAIKNACGTRLNLFVPDRAFEILVRRQISKLRSPCLACVERVFEELQRVSLTFEWLETKQFYNLKDKIIVTVNKMMQRFVDPTVNFINNLIDIELAYINIKHEDFMTGGEATTKAYTEFINYKTKDKYMFNFLEKKIILKKKPGSINSRELTEIYIIKNLLKSYFKIVKKNIGDMIPKTVMHLLVNKTRKTMQSELVSNIYKDEIFKSLLFEDPEVEKKRIIILVS